MSQRACMSCGTMHGITETVCSRCGAFLPTMHAPNTVYPPFYPPPPLSAQPPQQSIKILWILIVILLSALLVSSMTLVVVLLVNNNRTNPGNNISSIQVVSTPEKTIVAFHPSPTIIVPTPTPSPTQIPTPIPTQLPTPTPTTLQSETIHYKNLGVWQYWHTDGPYPQPPATNGAIVAHGDIQNDSNCHIKIFYSGDTVGNLGNGSFRLVQLTGGNRQAIHDYVVANIQSQLGDCPII